MIPDNIWSCNFFVKGQKYMKNKLFFYFFVQWVFAAAHAYSIVAPTILIAPIFTKCTALQASQLAWQSSAPRLFMISIDWPGAQITKNDNKIFMGVDS